MKCNKGLHMVTFTLVLVGALNWGLSIWGWDIANWGLGVTVDKIIYALVALSALYEIASHKSSCKCCPDDKIQA